MSSRLRYSSVISKCTLTLLCLAPEVSAEPTAADKALAVTLFRDGKALMDAGNLAEACGKLEESQRLDPGGGTLLNVALCHEKKGMTATAWAEFVEALGIARRDHRDGRIEFAQQHITALEANLSTITLVVSKESDEPDLELRRDGAAVGRAAWGTAIPVDPGEHTVEAKAPDKKPWRTVVSVGAAGATDGTPRAATVDVPVLEKSDTPQALPATTAPVNSASDVGATNVASNVTERDVGVRSSGHGQRTWGLVSLGVGALGLGAGTVFGVMAMNKKRDSDGGCVNDLCTLEAVEQNRDAGRYADFATIGFGVGIAGAVVGTVLLLTDSGSSARTARSFTVLPTARAGGAGLDVAGRF